MILLTGGKIVYEGDLHEDKAVLFDQKIRAVIPRKDAERLDAQKIPFSGILLPGFIDIHIHGAGGADTMDATPEALQTIADTILQTGTTSFLATTMTMEEGHIVKSLDNIRSFMHTQTRGAVCLGAHLEGPFLHSDYVGAQDRHFIQYPTRHWIEPFLDIIKMITLAPETDAHHQFIRELKDQVVLSIGHSGASFEEALASIDSGVRHITHCFNAMSGLHHREPGVVGAALLTSVSLDIITDLIHLHPALLSLIIQIKGVDKCIAITDSIRAAFLEEGAYDLGGRQVYVKDGACRLADGTLAGSVHRMDRAYENLRRHVGVSVAQASQMLSANAASLLGIDHLKGHIKEGYDADLVVMDGYTIQDVYVKGEKQ